MLKLIGQSWDANPSLPVPRFFGASQPASSLFCSVGLGGEVTSYRAWASASFLAGSHGLPGPLFRFEEGKVFWRNFSQKASKILAQILTKWSFNSKSALVLDLRVLGTQVHCPGVEGDWQSRT